MALLTDVCAGTSSDVLLTCVVDKIEEFDAETVVKPDSLEATVVFKGSWLETLADELSIVRKGLLVLTAVEAGAIVVGVVDAELACRGLRELAFARHVTSTRHDNMESTLGIKRMVEGG